MSMDPVMLGVAAPTIASGANIISQATNSVAQSFGSALQSAGQLLPKEPASEHTHTSEGAASTKEDPRFALLDKLLAGSSATNSDFHLTIENIQAHAEELQSDLQTRIQEALAEAGITLDSPLHLKISDTDGTLEVDGIHPQRAVIEAALNADPSLANDFQKLSSVQQILDTYSHSKAFAKEFSSQPWQAIAAQAGNEHDRHTASLEIANGSGQNQLKFD